MIAVFHLLRADGFVHILYTPESKAVARRTKRFFEDAGVAAGYLSVSRTESRPVSDAIGTVFHLVQEKYTGDSLALHYTGGTKSMSVHATAAYLSHAHRLGIVEQHLSYLDAASQCLIAHIEDDSTSRLTSRYVGHLPGLTLDDLTSLHGWKEEHREPEPSSLQAELSGELGALYARGLGGEYLRWKRSWRPTWLAAKEAPLAPATLNNLFNHPVKLFPDHPGFERLRELTGFIGRVDGTFGELAEALYGSGQSLVDTGTWLDGTWLETLVWSALREISPRHSLKDIRNGVTIVSDMETYAKFELDVTALRGSQLFLFSCGSSDDKGELKLKLFEAQARARQIGGDQARTCLVTASENPHYLEADVQSILKTDRVIVLGRRDLDPRVMETRLNQWILDQKGDAP